VYRSAIVDPATPHSARVLVARVSDLFLMDVHAMLRLPQPDVGITEACNFTIASALMNFISGVSVTLFEPPADRRNTGRKFRDVVTAFYPWNAEPLSGITNPQQGAAILYETFRNPMAHALGFQDPEPPGPISITRFPGDGFTEADLDTIETSVNRPDVLLRQAPTLRRIDATQAIELNAESFYWGARELVRRLTADVRRMAAAEAYLKPMLKVRKT
jgi:hypothetical protein